MPNDCWNHLIITSDDIEELKRLVEDEFQIVENGEKVCKKNVHIHQQCPRGVALEFLSGWAPPYDFLELLNMFYYQDYIFLKRLKFLKFN